MKRETLEVLLIDRALDELPAPTRELLDAYLGLDATAAREAEAWSGTWRMARRAMPSGAPERLPRPVSGLQRRWHGGWAAWRGEALRLAACLALGLAAGWLARGEPAAGGRRPSDPPPTIVSTMVGPDEARNAAGRFWSVNRLLAQRATTGGVKDRRHAYRLHWDSPVHAPSVKETQ